MMDGNEAIMNSPTHNIFMVPSKESIYNSKHIIFRKENE